MANEQHDYPGGLRSFYVTTLAVPCGVSLFIASLVWYCGSWDGAVCTFFWMMGFPVANFVLTQIHRLLWGRLLERYVAQRS